MNTNEQALEALIEQALCQNNGYVVGKPSDFNPKYALDEERFFDFLETTQKEELEKIQRYPDWKAKILHQWDKTTKAFGVFHLLRNPLKVENASFRLYYDAPLPNSAESIREKFGKNQFSIIRQLPYSNINPLETIDMAIFVNGIPFATIELKNHWTGQTAKVQGISQYKNRDTQQPILTFNRCIVHFAMDTDEIYMTTHLRGKDTFFLPFNKGDNYGKGNPINPNGHKTAYFWEEILTKESVASIIQHFVRYDKASKTLYFPRYHQLDVVRTLIKDVSEQGVGKKYLIQHSAGSGKSNSITWLAYRLIEAYPKNERVANNKKIDEPLFDSVIVVTDRRILDKQLSQNITQFSEVRNIVAHAGRSSELKTALESGKRIIITTIQKFPFIIEGIADMSGKQFAVVIDEAHSSQSGTSAGKLNEALTGKNEDADGQDYQEMILQAMQSRKMTPNASYFAFTATPKNTTLEKFGERQEDGSFRPFHLYSMKQAIEEGFILDVLANYSTFHSYYELRKTIEDNPEFSTAKAQKKLRAYVEKHQQTINFKAEFMLEHFMDSVVNKKKLDGKAKAMVVTQSIESAIRYYKALNEILEKKGNPFKILIAFSGEKTVDGIEYTEAQINGFAENETKETFDTDAYRILVVANKYLTGFDQPKLSAMYIDKKLQGVLAVQALSRLNRSANKYGKKTEDLYVLDFFNDIEDIKASFDPFYTATSLSEATDVNVLHHLKDHLDGSRIYEQNEVETFAKLFFTANEAQQLSPIIDTVARRFTQELDFDDTEKADYKIKAKQFVKIYAQVSSILPYEVLEWEKLFWFLKFLIPKMIVNEPADTLVDELLESVDLSTYALGGKKLNESILLDSQEAELKPQNPNARGAYGEEDEQDELEMIIKNFNEKWFQGWAATPEDQKIKLISLGKSIQAHPDFESRVAQNIDGQNRELALKKIIDDVMAQKRREEMELYRLYAQDISFNTAIYNTLKQLVNVR